MAVTYTMGSEETAPSFVSVDKAINTGWDTTLRVEHAISAGWSNNRVNKGVNAGFASKLQVGKGVNAGFQTYDLETLQILGEM